MKFKFNFAIAIFLAIAGCNLDKENEQGDGAPQQQTEVPAGRELDVPTEPPPGLEVGLEIGMVAPEIEGEDIDGQVFKLSDYRGKVVVLDFWGDW